MFLSQYLLPSMPLSTDYKSSTRLLANPYKRVKHITFDYHFIYEHLEDETIATAMSLLPKTGKKISPICTSLMYLLKPCLTIVLILRCKLMLLDDLLQFERECEESTNFGALGEHDIPLQD